MFQHYAQSNQQPALLYVIVFGSGYIKATIMLLFLFMLLQPVSIAFAAEEISESEAEPKVEAVVSEPAVETIVPESEAEPKVEAVVSEPAVETIVPESTTALNEEQESDEIAEVVLVPQPEAPIVDGQNATSSEAIEPEIIQATSTPVATSSLNASTSTETTTLIQIESITASTAVEYLINDDDATNAATSKESSFMTPTTTPLLSTSTNSVIISTSETVPTTILTTPELKNIPVHTLSNTDNDSASTTTEASTTDSLAQFVATVTDDTNRMQFGVSECILVGEGSYYCSTDRKNPTADITSTVYAAPDNGGDYEIFFRHNGTVIQITDNEYEDTAPSYDVRSESIVWHRLINGRYQIMRYDVDSKSETQLTDTTVNNMQPTEADGVIVWQRWLGNDWDIMMQHGVDDQVQLTHNEVHDIAPVIQGEYIIWHTQNATGDPQVAVYEIPTGVTSYINDTEGGEVLNPRFVLVYDTKFENGDVVTKGFNPVTGELVPLNAQPGPIPIQVPTPAPTGEQTALLQTKLPASRDDFSDELTPTTFPNPTSTPPNASTTLVSDVVIPSALTTSSTDAVAATNFIIESTASTSATILPLTDFDLIIEPYSTSSSAQSVDSVTASSSVE